MSERRTVIVLIHYALSPFPFHINVGLHPFETENDLNNFFQLHNKNRDFAVVFDNTNPSPTGKQFKYTIRTRNNNFKTDQIFWNNVYDVANKGIQRKRFYLFENCQHRQHYNTVDTIGMLIAICYSYLFTATDEYIDSGFLALQRSLDRAFIEQTTDQHNLDLFDV